MGDWNVFFATTAGSAATLVGLLFVATQLHLGALADPKNRWAALAQSTLTILSIAFALSASFLIPMLSPQVRGEIILLVVVVALWRSVRIWWPVVRLTVFDVGGAMLSLSPLRCETPGGWSSMSSGRAVHSLQRFPKPEPPGWQPSGLTRGPRELKA